MEEGFVFWWRHLQMIRVVIVSREDFGFVWCSSLRFLGFGAKHGLQKFLPVGTSRSSSLRRRSVSWWRHRDVWTLSAAFPTFSTDVVRCRSWQRILHFLLIFLLFVVSTRSTQIAASVRQCRRVVGFLDLLAAQKVVRLLLSELVQARFARGRRALASRLWPFEQPPRFLDVGAVEVGLSLGLRHLGPHLLGVGVSLVGKTFAEMSPLKSERNKIRIRLRMN